MNLAQRDWRDRQTPRMLTLLKAYESARPGERDLRSFEWAYLSGLCHTQTMTFAEHAHPVTCVAISPTENLAASGSGTSTFTGGDTEGFGEVRVWDPATGKLRHVLRGHKREVNAVAFSSDGKLLASGGRDNKVRIWNVASGAEIHVLNATGEVRSVAFHPTEPKLAAGTSGKDGRILVWNTRTGLEERTNFKHDNAALSVAFSPDGRWLVAGCGEPRNPRSGEIYIWETPTGKFSQLLLEQDGPVAALAFHPDGKTFASAGEGFIRIWTIGDADPIKRWKAHRERVNALAFDKTGDRLASGCTDSSAAIWNWLKVEDPEIRRGHTGGVRGVAFTSDGAQLLSAANDGTVKVWPARGDQEFHALMGHRDHVSEVAFSPDASRLVSAGHDQTVRIWESARPDEHRQLMGHTGAVQCVAFVFDVKKDAQAWHIVSGGDDATIRFWDAAGLKEVDRLDTPREQVRALAVSRDGTHLAYAGVWDGDENLPADITVLDTRTKKRIATLRGHNSHIASLAFRSDGLRLVSVSSGEVKIWDIASGGEIASIKRTNASKPRAVYSPDGKRLAVANGDVDKGRIAILDANSGKEEGILLNHSGLATALAFTPDGERLVTTDGQLGAPNIKLWDVQTGQEALSLRGPTGLVRSLVFSADGRRLACSGGPLGQPLGEIIVWESRRR